MKSPKVEFIVDENTKVAIWSLGGLLVIGNIILCAVYACKNDTKNEVYFNDHPSSTRQ